MCREKVHIPKTKRYIFLRGNGRGKTAIVWSESSSDNIASATFRAEAPDFIAFGISFKSCEIFVVDDKRITIRGRAKGPYSRVIFAHTYLSNSIVPEGWTNWSYDGTTEHLYHAEYKNHGPGARSEGRAPWSRQLSDEQAAPFLDINYIDGKNWLPAYL
ncbi:hypothetical protein TSUD_215400 [Trifolium subterraneum]|uniref:pectinesterase n=1 Tax=Trifolium subterraneum TaxID=3900 RepID=A0A2Z6M6U2_TRISU|nr:hypothetical protein TSUD_215400 [Trifolium subterraneum]